VAEYIRWLGSQGGKARRQSLTAEERSASASKASRAKWNGLTKAQRRAQAKKAATARWSKGKTK
jgi:hypothetical protein